MRIREALSPPQRRIITGVAIAATLLVWFLLTLPLLPAEPQAVPAAAPHAYSAQLDQSHPETPPGQAGAAGQGTPVVPPQAPPPPAPTSRPLVPAYILPSPGAVLAALVHLHTEEALVRSEFWSLWRITISFILAAIIAIPLGIFMGAYPKFKLSVEPLTGPMRFLPISAVTPLFVLWFGIGEQMKIAFLFLGTVVFLIPVVAEAVANVDEIYLETSYTLGARSWQTIWRVIVPAAWPGIFEGARVIYGIGWTYVILAELINAHYGLGYLITVSAKRGHVDWIYALLLVILLLGIGTNELFVLAQRKLFAWRSDGQI